MHNFLSVPAAEWAALQESIEAVLGSQQGDWKVWLYPRARTADAAWEVVIVGPATLACLTVDPVDATPAGLRRQLSKLVTFA